MPLHIIRQDISKVKADIIVNSTNSEPSIGNGVDKAIFNADLFDERIKLGHIDISETYITPSHLDNCKYVIHTVGPLWIDGLHNEDILLELCYRRSLDLLLEHELKSIAFPLISTGNLHFPKDLALNIAINTISEYLLKYDINVYIVVFDKCSYQISKKIFNEIEEFIDDNYISDDYDIDYSNRIFKSNIRDFEALICEETLCRCEGTIPDNLDDIDFKLDESFSECLLRLIDERNLKDSDVYKKANIDRKHFSKIRSNKHYQPKKITAIAFAIALELTLEETNNFIAKAGYVLTDSSKFDVIIKYFIKNHNYNIFTINQMLFHYDLPLIGV